MVSRSSSGRPRASKSIDQLRLGHIECQHQVERHAALGQHAIERFGLRHGARKAIEQAAACTVLLAQVDRRRCRPRRRRARACRRSCSWPLRGRARVPASIGIAKHFAGREMANVQIVLEPLGLRPLSRAGRTKEHDAHGRGERSVVGGQGIRRRRHIRWLRPVSSSRSNGTRKLADSVLTSDL